MIFAFLSNNKELGNRSPEPEQFLDLGEKVEGRSYALKDADERTDAKKDRFSNITS